MNTSIATQQTSASLQSEQELISVLQTSLYPGAAIGSVKMVLGYCKAAGLDPMQKPVHIVPMWDKNAKAMRDVVMPGIGLYRTQAARSGQYAGVTDPEFGPDMSGKVGDVQITYPAWCRVTVKRLLGNHLVEFSAREFWIENYATAGKDSSSPNAMWKKRPYGQIAKCAEAQALRKAFPEFGSAPTADEMEGKEFIDADISIPTKRQTGTQAAEAARPAIEQSPERDALIKELEGIAINIGAEAYTEKFKAIGKAGRVMVGADEHARLWALANTPVNELPEQVASDE